MTNTKKTKETEETEETEEIQRTEETDETDPERPTYNGEPIPDTAYVEWDDRNASFRVFLAYHEHEPGSEGCLHEHCGCLRFERIGNVRRESSDLRTDVTCEDTCTCREPHPEGASYYVSVVRGVDLAHPVDGGARVHVEIPAQRPTSSRKRPSYGASPKASSARPRTLRDERHGLERSLHRAQASRRARREADVRPRRGALRCAA
jgi:hypothetical protein